MCIGSFLIGTSPIFVRLSDLGPMATGFYRMLFALPLLALWMKWERKSIVVQNKLQGKDFGTLVLAGAFFALDLGLWNWSIDHTTIINSTLFNNTAAFFVPLMMWIFFKEIPSIRYIIAATVGFLGCILLIGESISISYVNLIGDIIALCSGIMVALYLISLKYIRDRISTGYLMFWTGLFSLIFLTIFVYVSGESLGPFTIQDVISIFGQAVLVHTMGQSLLAISLGKISSSYAALILFLAPLNAAALGWFFYNESLGIINLTGMGLIMLSIVSVKQRN
ncbi:MAG: DMT family transporter [Alphaproteobacteria bacterium]|nr:DMT family transporter [Alphaproteobacteria bacterium]